ncbi:hypothetical protein [Izhakiella australiensis]|uniref:hypothetical protein n=1 Tax=Izhakiella australiensis TaxID=1926881 RepID=UPI00111592E7|nr:hypothetical protein [Izhakiella australiensis]
MYGISSDTASASPNLTPVNASVYKDLSEKPVNTVAEKIRRVSNSSETISLPSNLSIISDSITPDSISIDLRGLDNIETAPPLNLNGKAPPVASENKTWCDVIGRLFSEAYKYGVPDQMVAQAGPALPFSWGDIKLTPTVVWNKGNPGALDVFIGHLEYGHAIGNNGYVLPLEQLGLRLYFNGDCWSKRIVPLQETLIHGDYKVQEFARYGSPSKLAFSGSAKVGVLAELGTTTELEWTKDTANALGTHIATALLSLPGELITSPLIAAQKTIVKPISNWLSPAKVTHSPDAELEEVVVAKPMDCNMKNISSSHSGMVKKGLTTWLKQIIDHSKRAGGAEWAKFSFSFDTNNAWPVVPGVLDIQANFYARYSLVSAYLIAEDKVILDGNLGKFLEAMAPGACDTIRSAIKSCCYEPSEENISHNAGVIASVLERKSSAGEAVEMEAVVVIPAGQNETAAEITRL